ARMNALAMEGDPALRSRPFDFDRSGFVMGEGAGALVLAAAEVVASGDGVLGEVSGWAVTTDAHHITAPDPDAGAASRCLRAALDRAGLAPGAIAHVNAHGT